MRETATRRGRENIIERILYYMRKRVRESGRDSDKERERETNCGVDHDTAQEGE